MTKTSVVPIAVTFLVAIGGGATHAGNGGVAQSCCTERGCGQAQSCTVTKVCKEVVYEEQERTFYRPVYKEEMVEKVIDTVEYVEETRYRCRPSTVWQPKPAECCDSCASPVGACGPGSCCTPQMPCKMVPVEIIRKVPYKVVVPKPVQKKKKVPRTVVTMEPYTITICIPHVVYRYVPVTICCESACNCKAQGRKSPCLCTK